MEDCDTSDTGSRSHIRIYSPNQTVSIREMRMMKEIQSHRTTPTKGCGFLVVVVQIKPCKMDLFFGRGSLDEILDVQKLRSPKPG